tara:strand:+ start:540 stop:818 length:279 start_codon:yes stop_codon:yes gene_type:complete
MENNTILNETITALKGSINNMFGDRDSLEEAMDYANKLARAEGFSEFLMSTAILVYHNSLIKAIIKAIEEDIEKEEQRQKLLDSSIEVEYLE